MVDLPAAVQVISSPRISSLVEDLATANRRGMSEVWGRKATQTAFAGWLAKFEAYPINIRIQLVCYFETSFYSIALMFRLRC